MPKIQLEPVADCEWRDPARLIEYDPSLEEIIRRGRVSPPESMEELDSLVRQGLIQGWPEPVADVAPAKGRERMPAAPAIYSPPRPSPRGGRSALASLASFLAVLAIGALALGALIAIAWLVVMLIKLLIGIVIAAFVLGMFLSALASLK